VGVRIDWDNAEKTIICYQFDGHWTWEEFFAAKEAANALMDTVHHKLGVILYTPHHIRIQANLLSNARNAIRNIHPQTVVVVIVVTNPLVRTMISTMRAITPIGKFRIDVASTLDEARVLVNERLQQANPVR
jgi:hypothetical protein